MAAYLREIHSLGWRVGTKAEVIFVTSYGNLARAVSGLVETAKIDAAHGLNGGTGHEPSRLGQCSGMSHTG